ncbi:MAG: hypothetical protein LBP53_02065 [Candidatus Peribacteria bacterium]|jgi:hypothetical protein|nr:hypothetical protein [Candidatus Peribacteria bacterium]
MLSKKTAIALGLMGLLWFADSSAVGTLVQGHQKKAKTIVSIQKAQDKYEKTRKGFRDYIDDVQKTNEQDFKRILDDEKNGMLGTKIKGE